MIHELWLFLFYWHSFVIGGLVIWKGERRKIKFVKIEYVKDVKNDSGFKKYVRASQQKPTQSA